MAEVERAAKPAWPELPHAAWADTLETLHMWLQIVGKVRTGASPWVNHSWSTTLYVTPRGLTTSAIPHGDRTFEIELDFLDHRLRLRSSDGVRRELRLEPRTVADFHGELTGALRESGLGVAIHPAPNEVVEAIPFAEDEAHRSYEAAHAEALHGALVQADRVMKRFRASFVGKASPVHFFWGAMDLAVTRFSGRTAPEHPGGFPNLPDEITREAYSHEVSSCGFWPGDRARPEPIFYSYAYPAPEGFAGAAVEPDAAFWLEELGEFALPWEAVRTSGDPDATLLAFLESTYGAAAELGGWDREALEREPGWRPLPRWRG